MKYDNWQPTMDHLDIESQVASDLREAISTSQEVMDRLTGKDELEEKLKEILEGYKALIVKRFQEDTTRRVAEQLTSGLTPIIAEQLKRFLFPTFHVTGAINFPPNLRTAIARGLTDKRGKK